MTTTWCRGPWRPSFTTWSQLWTIIQMWVFYIFFFNHLWWFLFLLRFHQSKVIKLSVYQGFKVQTPTICCLYTVLRYHSPFMSFVFMCSSSNANDHFSTMICLFIVSLFSFLSAEDVHLHLPAQLSPLYPPIRTHVEGVSPVHGATATQRSSSWQGVQKKNSNKKKKNTVQNFNVILLQKSGHLHILIIVYPVVDVFILPFQMRVRKIAPKVLQLLTEWTETFPYDFRDERMMRSLKELTHRLASGDEVGACYPMSLCYPS